MKRKATKLAVEIHEVQFVRAADICNRGAKPLCVATEEIINKHIFADLFQNIPPKNLFMEKVFGIN